MCGWSVDGGSSSVYPGVVCIVGIGWVGCGYRYLAAVSLRAYRHLVQRSLLFRTSKLCAAFSAHVAIQLQLRDQRVL